MSNRHGPRIRRVIAPRLRIKAASGLGDVPRLQMAEPAPGGVTWRNVPMVPASAPDWEDNTDAPDQAP